jgi:hypothetical protein
MHDARRSPWWYRPPLDVDTAHSRGHAGKGPEERGRRARAAEVADQLEQLGLDANVHPGPDSGTASAGSQGCRWSRSAAAVNEDIRRLARSEWGRPFTDEERATYDLLVVEWMAAIRAERAEMPTAA